MGAAQDLLTELEALGAVGSKHPIAPPVVEEAPPESDPRRETPAALDGVASESRELKMMQLCERAANMLTKTIEAQTEVRDLFIEMRDIWADFPSLEVVEGPGDEEDTDEEEEGEEEDDGPDAASLDVPEGEQQEVLEAEAEAEAELEEERSPFDLPPAVPFDGEAPSVTAAQESVEVSEPVEARSGLRPVLQVEALPPRRQRFFEKLRAEAAKSEKSHNIPR